jgi:hypothetical protein
MQASSPPASGSTSATNRVTPVLQRRAARTPTPRSGKFWRRTVASKPLLYKICRSIGISEQTYYKWRREYGGLKIDQAKRLKELERENERLKKAVSELTLDKQILKEALSGKY